MSLIRPGGLPDDTDPAPLTDPADVFAAAPTDDFLPRAADDENVAAAEQSMKLLLDRVADDECTEVVCNGPNEVYAKIKGVYLHLPEIQFGSTDLYHDLLDRELMSRTGSMDRIAHNKGLVEGQLRIAGRGRNTPPMLARVHMTCPPAVKWATVTIAKKGGSRSLDEIAATGAMSPAMSSFLKAVARGRGTIVISGPTGAGKTTLLQAISAHFDSSDRILVIEDTPELRLPLGNTVYAQSTPERPGLDDKDRFTLEWFVRQGNRQRMDRIIVGECRGPEFAEWLLAANSGAEGSVTTMHANDPRQALQKMMQLGARGMTGGSEDTVLSTLASTIDVVVQASLVDRRNVITSIKEVSDTVSRQTKQVQLQDLFAYDRASGRHVVEGRPSDRLASWLDQRGVAIDPAWFRN